MEVMYNKKEVLKYNCLGHVRSNNYNLACELCGIST